MVLDKWDLKEGHDINAFMESMVRSEEIEKVLVICDRGYKTKAEEYKWRCTHAVISSGFNRHSLLSESIL
ncbi:hypothetical protein MUG84_04630 [Paenibacillus sp. KQZ6P-2]|uniref:Uncharacterized protein n=1 Tax=Paenibacillus mangrovi TaxID=2931978 RepID=A0A9X2B4F9_9BACL|nr:hypothetical protein [Paenibacillus mangrovi]